MSLLSEFLEISREELLNSLDEIREEPYRRAAELIWRAEARGNRLHVTGIGKPAHVASYMASLLSSTGTPAYFLHGTEAVHGSCGQLVPGDVVICISNSGETAEMKATAAAVRRNGAKIIAVTGSPDSWLARFADAHLYAGVAREGGPLLAETLALQALSVVLQEKRNITPEEYVLRHPGGSLGKLRDDEIQSHKVG